MIMVLLVWKWVFLVNDMVSILLFWGYMGGIVFEGGFLEVVFGEIIDVGDGELEYVSLLLGVVVI